MTHAVPEPRPIEVSEEDRQREQAFSQTIRQLIQAMTQSSNQSNRRQFLRHLGAGFGMVGMAPLMASAQPDAKPPTNAGSPSLMPKPQHFPGKAKRVIQIFCNGGPSHIDTFDPKPALKKYAGKKIPVHLKTERETGAAFPSPFKFTRHGQSGLPISELYPHLAKHADDLCVIRSMQAEVPNHEPSLSLMNCGASTVVRPSVGSWTLYGLGTENQNLPGFVALSPNGYPIKGTQNWQSAFLPGIYQGTYIQHQNKKPEQLIEHLTNNRLSDKDQRRLLDLVQDLNKHHRDQRGHDDALNARIQSYELAFRMQSEALDAFDINREPKHIREMYGNTPQSRQLLMARRLVERGVRYVQLWHGGGQPWDAHDEIEKNHRRLAGQHDQGIGALLTDLKARGMLDETLIIWGGEFGRTPTVELPKPGANAGKINGRDHNHYGFTVWLAGGGVKGGTTYGRTDDFGFKAVENPVPVHDLHATVLALMGLDHTKLTYRHAGRDFRLTDVFGNVLHDIIA